jgi:hypothetical protein
VQERMPARPSVQPFRPPRPCGPAAVRFQTVSAFEARFASIDALSQEAVFF